VRGRDRRSLGAARSLSRVDACNPLLQAHPTWARDEHEGRGIPTSLTPVSGRLALPPSRSPSHSTHLGWGTRRHSLVGPGTPRSRNADTYPLPRIDQIVDSTARCVTLSFLDAYSGYHQIKMKESDQLATSFITPFGMYCYTTMPFGLRNTGATYQRCTNHVFGENIGRTVEA
jgi:hypothetical protein